MTKRLRAAIAAMLALATLSLHAQTGTTPAATTTAAGRTKKARQAKEAAESPELRAIRELREQMAAQQAELQSQIDALKSQLAARDAAVSSAQQAAAAAQSQAAAATAQAQSASTSVRANSDAVSAVKSDVNDLKTVNTSLASTISANKQELNEKIDSPTTIRYKGVTITPVAFFAAEDVFRTRSINSDINTPFNTTPFMGANQAHVSEFNFSGRQSRLGGLFEGSAGAFRLAGYFEADFLGSGTTSNANQSNSYVLRQRQFWGQAATQSGFTFTGGQMWSLATENGRSTDNRTEKLPNTVDAQYHVGFSWARQPALRLQQRFASADDKSAFTVAVSLEESQITNETATNPPGNFFFNGTGTNGGLFNNTTTYTNNVAPDVIVKAAADIPHAHFELGGVARFFRDRIYPATSTAATGYVGIPGAAPYNSTVTAGGIFGSARVSPSKYVDVALSAMAGDGVGRYGSSQLADVTVHPNGTFEPIRNYHGQFSLETHPTPRLDVYGYAGAEYAQRTVYATGVTASPFTGYAPINVVDTGCNTEVAATAGSTSPAANCSAVTRDIVEGTAGFTYRIYSSPRFGRIQYQATYSYLTRTAWLGLTGGTFGASSATFGAPKATNNMVFTSFRYYIP